MTASRSLPRVLAALLAAAAATPASAVPTITRVDPPGAARGTTIDVVLGGGDLTEPRELFFEEPGIAVERLEAVDGRQVKARLRVAPDSPTGPRKFRLRTADGLSDLRTFRVGMLPQEAESEPNGEPDTAGSGAVPRTVSGVVKSEDIDCFKVRLPAGGRLAAAIDAMRLDQEMFDPHIEIADARGFVLAACDDHPLLGPDAMLAVVAPEAGDYVLRVRESAYRGSDECVYLLHLGDFPVPHLAWPPAGPPGGRLTVEWLGDPSGPFSQEITLPGHPRPDGIAEIHPVREGVAGPVAVPLRVSSLPATADAEPNNAPGKAVAATAPGALVGRLDTEEDVDWFRIEAVKGSRWHVRAWGRRLGSPIDLVVNIHRANDKRERVTGNDDAAGPDSAVEVTTPDEGAFLVRINDHLHRGGPEFVYWIEVQPVVPAVHVAVPPGRPNTQERLAAVVPRGNRTALLFNAAREGFAGPVRIGFEGLPEGVQAVTADLDGKSPATLVVFEAAADAAEATTLTGVAVTAVDDGRSLGGLRQTIDLVPGQGNGGGYRATLEDRLPVAVVGPAPIRVELEPPEVPIVRRGSLELKVRVERLEGREGKVRLFLPFRPPGIGGPSTVEIPADKSEAVYPISANPEAALGDWQLAITAMLQPGEKSRGDGEMLVSSRLAMLRVAEPIVELAAEATSVEQGRETRIVWKVQKPGEFSGAAKARLLGLPAKTAAPELELMAAAEELAFPVSVDADAPAGAHKNVFCEIRVPQGEAWILHATPPTQLRIDKPLPPEEDETP